MAKDDVAVTFGASIDQLLGGIKQSQDAIKGFADSAKSAMDKVTAPFAQLQSAMLAIGALAAGGAVFGSIIKSTLDTTSEVTDLKKAFGGTMEEANHLAGTLKLLGISTDAYTGYALRLDRQIRTNNETFQRMGFTARDLDLGQKGLMDKAIGKLLEYREGVDRNIAAQTLFGRNVKEIYPLLRTTLEGVNERAAELHEKLGLTVTADDKTRARSYKVAMTELGMAFDGIKKAIGEAVLPYLTRFAQWFVSQAPSLIGGMKASVRAVIEFAFDLAAGFANFSVMVMGGLFKIFEFAQYVRSMLGYVSESDALKSIDRMKAGLENLSKMRDQALVGLDSVKAGIMAGGPSGGNTFDSIAKGTKSADNLINDKSNIAALQDYYRTAIKLQDDYFAGQKERLETDLRLNRISEGEKTQLLLAAVATRERTEIGLLDQELKIGNLSKMQRQKIEDEKTLLIAKAGNERQKILDEELIRNMQGWESTLGTIQSAFDGQLRGLLAGTTSWAAAMKAITADLVLKMISEFAKLAIVKPLASLFAGFAPPAELFTSILKAIMASVGQVFAGVSAFLAPILGPAAPAAAAGVAAGVETAAVGMAKFDKGAWNLPSDMVAQVHAGETIIPAGPAQAFRDLLSGGGGGWHTLNFNISAADPRGFRDMVMSNKGAFADVFRALLRDGVSMRPA